MTWMLSPVDVELIIEDAEDETCLHYMMPFSFPFHCCFAGMLEGERQAEWKKQRRQGVHLNCSYKNFPLSFLLSQCAGK